MIRSFLLAGFICLCGCSTTVPFVQINIGTNDISNALMSADKGPRITTASEIGDGSTVTKDLPELELTDKESGMLDALSSFENAFKSRGE